MKRLLLVTACLLTVIGLRAQSLRTCRYWYDRDIGNAITTSFNGNNGQLHLNVDALVGGLHTLHLQVADASMNWGATKSFLFMKPEDYGLENLSYRCWFDYDIENQQSGSFGNGSLLMDVTNLSYGMHTLHLQLEGSTITSTKSYLFLKPEDSSPEDLSYRCWFDYDVGNQQTGFLETGSLLLDVSNLSDGIHTLHLQLKGSTMVSTKSYIFLKVPTYSGELQYRCWFDEVGSTVLTGQVNSGVFLLDVTALSIGQHDLNIQLFNGNLSSPRNFSFYRGPVVMVSANPVEGGTTTCQINDTICTLTATANEGYVFINWTENGIVLSTDTSYEFTVTGDATFVANFQQIQTIELTEGWNWFSTYIEADDLLQQLEASLGENGLYIESSELLSTEYLDGEWLGDLEEVGITNEQMYLIQTSAACTIQLQDLKAHPANHVITINPEWNWVGYLCSEEMTIAEALAGFVPEDGDQIESMEGYAEYLDGEWLGLETLKPGEGFLYYSNSATTKTFTFPASAK